MNADKRIEQVHATFEAIAGERLSWTHELTELADGYLTFQRCAMDADDPLTVAEGFAMARGLVAYAHAVGWVTKVAYERLIGNAIAVRKQVNKRWAGQLVVVPVRATADAAPAETRH